MPACPTCPDVPRCDRLGVCQAQAKEQLSQPPCSSCKGEMLVPGSMCDLEVCEECGGSGRETADGPQAGE